MRTTLTIDDDVAARLAEHRRRTGQSFKEVVNRVLRDGLQAAVAEEAPPPFRVRARSLGGLRRGLSLDNVGELLERIEGPGHR